MNFIAVSILALNTIAVVGAFVARQMNKHKDLFRDGTILLEASPAAGTVLAHPHSYVQHGTLVIKGCVHREPGTVLTGGGEVHISLRSPEGEKLDASVGFLLPSDQTESCAPFRADFKVVPRSGTTALIKWTFSTEPVSSRPGGKVQPPVDASGRLQRGVVRRFVAANCAGVHEFGKYLYCPAASPGFLQSELNNEI